MICLSTVAPVAHAAKVSVAAIPDDGVHPQAQIDARGRAHLIYFKGDPRHGDIFYARSDDGAATFTPPMRVNSQPNSTVIIGTIRGPHVAIGQSDRVHVAWMGSDVATEKGGHAPMLYTRLNDASDGFESQRNVIGSHPGLDGGGSVAADRDGNVYVAWHAPPGITDMDEGHRQVWLTRSRDDGATFDAETACPAKPTGACGCCGLSISAADRGRVAIVFRSATQSVNRDIHVLMSRDYGKSFDIAAVDPWRSGKCVMSTAAVTWHGQTMLAAWETWEQVWMRRFGDSGSDAAIAMPGEAAGRKHPAIAVNDAGETLVAWSEGTGWNKGGAVAWQLFDAAGKPIAHQHGRVNGLRPWSLPAVVATREGNFKLLF